MGDNIDPNTIQQVQNILQDLVANLLLHKPEEPIPNMLQYLQDLKREGAPPLTKDERIELHSLKEEQEKLKGKLKAKLQTMKTLAKPVPAPLMEAVSSDSMDEGKNDEVTSSDSEDEDEKQDTVETQPLSTTEHK